MRFRWSISNCFTGKAPIWNLILERSQTSLIVQAHDSIYCSWIRVDPRMIQEGRKKEDKWLKFYLKSLKIRLGREKKGRNLSKLDKNNSYWSLIKDNDLKVLLLWSGRIDPIRYSTIPQSPAIKVIEHL